MPLQKTLVPVDIVAGLDTKNDPKLTPALTDLQNGRYTVGSQISKRLGYTALSQNISGTTDLLSSGDGLTSFQDELLEFSGSRLYSYSSSVSRWTDKGGFQSVKVDSDDVIRNTSEAKNQDSCIASSLQLFAWEQYSATTGALEGVYASVFDSVTGAIFQAATLIDATAINPRCIRLGPNPTLCYLDTSASPHLLKTVQVDTNNPVSFLSVNTISSLVNPTNPIYDVAIYSSNASSGNGVFVYNNSGTTRIDVGYLTTDGALGTPGSGFPGVVTITSTNATDTITVCADKINTAAADEERIYVAYASTGSSAGLKLKRLQSLLSVEATHTVEGTATKIDSCSMIVTQAGDLQIIYTLNATNTYDHMVKGTVYDISADSVATPAIIKRSVGLASKIWEYAGAKYFMVVHDSALQPTYFLCDTTGLISAKVLPGTAGALPTKTFLSGVDASATGVFKFGGLVRTRLISKNNDLYSLTGVSNITIDFTSVERFEAAELGGNLHIGGGFVSMYDSQQIVELGFHLYPENITAAVNNSSGSLAAGTYLYQTIWRWTDAKGQDHRSAPSVAISAAPSGGSSTVTLTIPSLRLTQKTNVICEVYRTVTTGRLLFKIGNVANNTAADSVSFADTSVTDANLVAFESLYTNGGIIENIPPPASLVLTNYKNRLVCVSSENPKELIYSKKRQPLGPVEFTDVFSIVLNKAVRITALAEFDQKLIIFEPNQIFYITGNGPTATGSQDDFSPPQIITGDVGCSNTNSLVLMPLGLMFQSNKGIYLLNRSLETVYIGADVEAYNDLTITSAELIQNENQIRYLTSDGRCLIYDYFYGKWSTWTNHSGNGATIWNANGNYVYLRSDGRIFEQSATSYKDDNDPIEMSITTSWVKTNGIQGFQRIRRAFVLGDFKSTHTLQLEIGHDYQTYFNEKHLFNQTNDLEILEYGDSTPYGTEGFFGTSSGVADGVYQFRAHCKKQKCQSVRFRISDVEEANPGQAYSISSLMLEVGVRSNTMKLPAQKLT
jgi:hypothetical protein